MKLEVRIRRSFAFSRSEITFANPFSEVGIFISDFVNVMKQTSSVNDMKLEFDIDMKHDTVKIIIPLELFDNWQSKEQYVLSVIRDTFNRIKPIYHHRKQLSKQETLVVASEQLDKVIELYNRSA